MPGGSRTPARRAATLGVTLLELLVVLAIVGLIVGVSAPSVSAGLDSVRLRTATSSVAGFFNAAVTRVDRRQQPVELVIYPGENRIAAYSTEAGFHRELRLPDGVSIEAVLAGSDDEGAGPQHILLLPGATAPGFGVLLANRHGTRRTVKLDPMTGYPRENAQAQ
jgi:prepilin-type N-terminal cleavage/methylation domain-containing protein